ncbi:hypothetical protein [Paludibacterium yongneupense]|uniref:hypothetical protein n=1 Tax=Paludibacterium yongneupense TaxID=400061 RepID=UPI0003FE0B8A|nr:hypothetical protein [Paludibacterium yongneupense]
MNLDDLDWRAPHGWPLALQLAAATLLCLSLAGACHVLHLSARIALLDENRAVLAREYGELARARQAVLRQPVLRSEIARLAPALPPADTSPAAVFLALRQQAVRHGIALEHLLPGEQDGESHAIRIDASLHGEFHAVVDFWQALAALPATVACDSFALAVEDWPRLTLRVRLLLLREPSP